MPASASKKRRAGSRGANGAAPPSKRKPHRSDADLIDSSDSESDGSVDGRVPSDAASSSEDETSDARRLRLARAYLDRTADGGSSSSGGDESDDGDGGANDALSSRLRRRRQRESGSYVEVPGHTARQISGYLSRGPLPAYHRGADHTPAACCLSRDGSAAYVGAKDGSVFSWDVERSAAPEGGGGHRTFDLARRCTVRAGYKAGEAAEDYPPAARKFGTLSPRNARAVASLAVSDDGRTLAAGRRDGTVALYDVRAGTGTAARILGGHRSSAGAVALCDGGLYTAADDRTVRRYHLDRPGGGDVRATLLETLYGHQSAVTGIALAPPPAGEEDASERPVTVGMDRTARVWQVDAASHLVLRAGSAGAAAGHSPGFAECVCVVADPALAGRKDAGTSFVTCGSAGDGTVALWSSAKKRPVHALRAAHGNAPGEDTPAGVLSCASVVGSANPDVFATGSHDGFLRVWRVRPVSEDGDGGDPTERKGRRPTASSVVPIGKVPVAGFINGVALGPRGRFAVAACGREHRLGRWGECKGARNRVAIVDLQGQDDHNTENDDEDGDSGADDDKDMSS